MNLFLRNCCLVFLGFSLLCVFGYLAQVQSRLPLELYPNPTQRGHVFEKMEEWNLNTNNADIDHIWLGSSTCLYGINQDVLFKEGFNTFSFCSPSQTIENSRLLLEVILSKQKVKTIIIDAYPDLWERPPLSNESAQDWIINLNVSSFEDFTILWVFTMKTWRMKPILIANSLAKSVLWICQYSMAYETLEIETKGRYIGRGSGAILTTKCTEDYCKVGGNSPSSKDYLNELKKVKAICDAKSAKLIVHVPPTRCDFKLDAAEFRNFTLINGQNWEGHRDESYFDCDDHLLEQKANSYSFWLSSQFKQIDL